MKAETTTGISPPAPDGQAANAARMAALLEAAVDTIICIDERGHIQVVNPAAEKLFGYPASELIGKNVSLLMPSPYREGHDGYLMRYLTTGEKRIIGIGREVLGQRRDGTTFPMDLSVAEADVGADRIFVGIIRDISERKRAEATLRQSHEDLVRVAADLHAKNEEIRTMTQQLWQAAKLASVGELAASVAHELNNPLATITLRIESVLARTAPDDWRRRPLEIVEQESKRMGELVANLLQFSRRSSGQVSTLDIRQELTKSVDLINHHLRKLQIAVMQEFVPETPTIYGDRQKMRQVFLNLLSNAGDAMPKGGTLTLRTKPAMLPNGAPAVQIEFVDTGVGIASGNLKRIMEPFFTTKEEGHGTGLGLAICRRVIQEHQGTIEVASELGKGTTINIVLPVHTSANVGRLRGADLKSDWE